VVGVVDVHLENRRGAIESLHNPLGETESPAEIGDDDLGAFRLGNPGNVIRDGIIGGNPGD
jgi:hypothetical protein